MKVIYEGVLHFIQKENKGELPVEFGTYIGVVKFNFYNLVNLKDIIIFFLQCCPNRDQVLHGDSRLF